MDTINKSQEIRKRRVELGYPSTWKQSQRKRVAELIQQSNVTLAYWNSDKWGRPCNGGKVDSTWLAKPGLVQEIPGPLELCGARALHATLHPHAWKGDRVWLVAMFDAKVQENKLGSLKREFLGEILPEQALFDQSLAIRLGVLANLTSVDLTSANLRSANLTYADLRSADLTYADLTYADLRYADLRSADLTSADLTSADLRYANLTSANLRSANLTYADLTSAFIGTTPAYIPTGWISVNGYLQRK